MLSETFMTSTTIQHAFIKLKTIRNIMVDTVKFNVGGRHFEVSRALIDQHPDTMLAKMISETWEKEPDNPIFIDRDGDMFDHVLNYVRYGSIDLPISIPRTMFQRELDYYGIIAQESAVKQQSFGELVQMNREELARKQRELKQQELISGILSLAAECNHKFSENTVQHWIAREHPLWNDMYYARGRSHDLLKGYLSDYFGLNGEISIFSTSVYFIFSTKRNSK